MAKRLRTFSALKATLLVWAAYQGLGIRKTPSNLTTKCLLIELNYEAQATLKFSFKKAYILPREYLAQHAVSLFGVAPTMPEHLHTCAQ